MRNAEQPVGRHGLALPFERQRPNRLGPHIPTRQLPRLFANYDRSRFRGALQARGDVGRIADRRRVHPQIATDRAEHDEAGVDAHVYPQFASAALRHCGAGATDSIPDRQRREQRTPHMILMRDGRPEQSHEPIAGELRRGASVSMHLCQRSLDEPADQFVHRLGSEAFGDDGRVDHIAEQHGDLFQFAVTAGQEWCGLVMGPSRQGRSTLAAEFVARWVICLAALAQNEQRRSAIAAKPHTRGIFGVTLRARHAVPPNVRAGRIQAPDDQANNPDRRQLGQA